MESQAGRKKVIYRQRCARRGEETSQRGGRLRHVLSSSLIYSYWARESFTAAHTAASVIHSPEHILENKLGKQKLPFSSAAGSQRIPES